jgi:hypothetical protein
MNTPINPQEIYLLERYTSLEYFAKLRDTWGEMVSHVENTLARFMQNLPPDYRSRPLPEQPDIVWGEHVLPNFRDSFQSLCSGFIKLSHGDMAGLHAAHGPLGDFKGQLEFWSGWMPKADQLFYTTLLNRTTTMAGNITTTEGAYWRPLSLSNYSDQRGSLDPPAQWPTYRINKNVSVITGEKTRQSGIYVPDLANSCAEFLSTKYNEAPSARVLVSFDDLLDPITGEKYGEEPVFERRNCIWYLVERTADLGSVPGAPTLVPAPLHRIAAGETCPESGFYFTPARRDSRRLFQKGEVMPAFDTAYGTTIWQWDSNQA